jgi:hypothetical protein
MELTKWLKPSLGYRSQDVLERPLNYELDVHQHLVNFSYWPNFPVRGYAQEQLCLGCERQVTARYRT